MSISTTLATRTRRALTASLLAAGLIGGGLAAAGSAEAASPTMNRDWTPWMSTTSQGGQYWTVKAGTTVQMRCWDTGSYQNGTGKWFSIQSNAYPYTTGYVPATTVSYQITVGHC